MLKPKSKAPAAVPRQTSSKEAARALLSMLGEGASGGEAVPDAQMRLLARDLLAQVEGRPPPEKPPGPEPERAPERRRKLFSRAKPLAPPPEAEAPQPEPVAAPSVAPPSEPGRAQVDPRQALAPSELPTSFAAPVRRTRRTPPVSILSAGQVRKLAMQGIELGETEHPAVIALALRGRPPLEQAVALRALPRGQARAVHRALRMMEGRG